MKFLDDIRWLPKAPDVEKLVPLTEEQERIWLTSRRTILRLFGWWGIGFCAHFLLLHIYFLPDNIGEIHPTWIEWYISRTYGQLPYILTWAGCVLFLAMSCYISWRYYRRKAKGLPVDPMKKNPQFMPTLVCSLLLSFVIALFPFYFRLCPLMLMLWAEAYIIAFIIDGIVRERLRRRGIGQIYYRFR